MAPSRRQSLAVRQSWTAYDSLIERAFALKDSPIPSPTLHPRDMDATSSELTLPADPDPIHTDQSTLDPVWEEVREQKAKILAGLPSKVKSLEGMVHVVEQPALEVERPRLRRKNRLGPAQLPRSAFLTFAARNLAYRRTGRWYDAAADPGAAANKPPS